MTPFAQLGNIVKSANGPAAGYTYQTNKNGLHNPYAPQVSTAAAPSWKKDVAMLGGEFAGDVALGSNPVTGVPWFLGKTIYQAAKGNWGQAATNLGMGALSFLPGAASGAAIAKGAVTAGKVGRIASAASKYKSAIGAGQELAAGGVAAVKALPSVAKTTEMAGRGIAAAKASGVGTAITGGIDATKTLSYGVKPLGIEAGKHTWNAGAATGRFAGAGAVTIAKQAPLNAVTGMLPNKAPTQLAPPPAALNSGGSFQDMVNDTFING